MEEEKEKLKISFSQFVKSIQGFFYRLLSIGDEVDKSAADESIRKDVDFQGFNVWILFCSVLICSIGLNMNSTAVVIGAMLISPLMGPLVGMGYSVGTFDRELLIRSFKNLGNALIISILASFLFFKIAPTSYDQSELLARTRPILLDLFVALFGGFAGILAAVRRIKTNVIPGVAIATALMPPLCTAGYALAASNWSFFLGAFYLFFINSVMITLSALVVVWYLRFPKKTYVNKAIQGRVRWFIIIFAFLVSIPSIYLYGDVLRETIFFNRANTFLDDRITDAEHKVFDPEFIYHKEGSYMRLFVYGRPYTEEQIDSFRRILPIYNLKNTQLEIENMGSLEESRTVLKNKELEVSQKEKTIEDIQLQLLKRNEDLNVIEETIKDAYGQLINVKQLNREVLAQYDNIERIAYSIEFLSQDSLKGIPTFLIHWKDRTRSSQMQKESDKFSAWLHVKYKNQFDSIQVVQLR